jgi:hypothetical protein
MRVLQGIDLATYWRALGMFVRNPALVLAPLVVGAIGIALLLVTPSGGGAISSLTGGLTQLIVMLLDSFGLGVSIVLGDAIWRRGRASVGDAWDEAKRKAGDIFMAALGLNLVLWVAGTVGTFAGGIAGGLAATIGGVVLTAVAAFFLIYTVPAAAIGGIPGAAALQVSVERVQRNIGPTLVLALVFLILLLLFPIASRYIVLALDAVSPLFVTSLAVAVIDTILKAIGLGYLALVMAKVYADISYGRRY